MHIILCSCMYSSYTYKSLSVCTLELKQISESVGYPVEIYYPDSDPEPFKIVANYFEIDFELQNFYSY